MLIHSPSTSVSNLFLNLDFSDRSLTETKTSSSRSRKGISYSSIVIDRSRRVKINFFQLMIAFDIREYCVDFSTRIMPTWTLLKFFPYRFKITKAFRAIKIFSRRADLFLGYVAILLSIEFLYHIIAFSDIKQIKCILCIEIPRAFQSFQSSLPTKWNNHKNYIQLSKKIL